MEMCRREMMSRPSQHTMTIRRNARRMLHFAEDEDDAAGQKGIMVEVVKGFHFGKARAVPYLTCGIAHAADLMHQKKHDEAEALLATLVMAAEQSTLESGRWSLAWLLTHLPEPPWAQIALNPPPDPLRPFGRLAEPGWTAAAMAYTKDAAALGEIRKKVAGSGKGEGKGKEEP